ncbi:DEAD/DEAH box helicase [Robertmurraya kyonggiensis]|uniref:DEAD/DEAH box helicase n=1 Tax=Robertmurraya kyonggiensis TaxID=1037680 RepID=A0A4U1D244_9BACI|nr:DEAD/DEAH box helicase [Robertmurraya kyonggiensis]TKC16301.1 DEAD/DEAH box helicase [Robertmurraya kyonggiensis]
MSELVQTEMKPFIQAVWEKEQFGQPTQVQTSAIPLILEGKDVLAESPTGTGKTLAYLLPVLNKIDPDKKSIQVVILASSQELVMQILQEVQKWSEGSGIRSASFIGGANVKRQLEKLKKNPQIIAGTPGRLFELIKQKKVKMHEVKTIVLDEGDQLLTHEHLPTVQNIIRSALADRQVVLFSATLSKYVEKEAKDLMKDPEVIRIEKDETIQAGKVEHIYFIAEQREKLKLLEKVSRLPEAKALVFIKDIGNLTVAGEKLAFNGIETALLHSDLNKDKRKNALKDFRTGKVNMLLATDVAARGLDIKGVTHVVHLDFPQDIEQYVHRSGRTGRFGADGTVISLVTEREERELKKFCRELNISVERKVFFKGDIVSPDARR